MNNPSISNPPTSFPTLLPCPFCQQSGPTKVGYWPDLNGQNPRVRCVCGAVMAAGVTEEDAIANWNTRPQLQSTEAVERAEEFLQELDGWEQAYPLSAFPEPDLKKAAELLKAGGMTLDAISASNMRHVVSELAPKARAAITALTSPAVVEDLSKQDKLDG